MAPEDIQAPQGKPRMIAIGNDVVF